MGALYNVKPIYRYTEQNKQQDITKLAENAFACCQGRMFGAWIDLGGRTNGFSEGDLIENPAYIIESLLRDETFVERDLTITGDDDVNKFSISGLAVGTDDFYNNAYVHNVTNNETDKITDYNGASKQITTNSNHAGWTTNDLIYITNINGNTKINATSFDDIGGSGTGLRDGWNMAVNIYSPESTQSIINAILHESFMMLAKTDNVYKLVAIEETAGTPDTWTNPLKSNGAEMIRVGYTPIENVYTDFRLKYDYVHGKDTHLRELFVNKNGYSSNGLSNGATLQTACGDAETNYRVKRKFEYQTRFISINATADNFLNYSVNWLSRQHCLVEWGGTFNEYCEYEVGDIVKLNYAKYIPGTLNNSAQFMIYGKSINMRKGDPYIVFNLIEL